MEREISGGAMLGIVLLALAAVIGLGFGVFAITKGVANEGTVNVQDSLGAVSTQIFLDYDQKIITGTQAASALKQFEGKPYAVVIGTKGIQSGTVAPGHNSYPIKVGTTKFINYNALISDKPGAKDWTTANSKVSGGTAGTVIGSNGLSGAMTLDNGAYIIQNGFLSDGGTIVYDKNTGGVFKQGNGEYIPPSVKFQANLIKDPSGNIMGIVLEQQ